MGAHSEPKVSQFSQHTTFLQRERCKIHSQVMITGLCIQKQKMHQFLNMLPIWQRRSANLNRHHHWKKCCLHLMKFFWSVDNIFVFSVLIFENHVVRIFFLWNAYIIFRLFVFSGNYLHQYLENKCCPHFLLMKCGQHFKLSACCPVIHSCPHFINTP